MALAQHLAISLQNGIVMYYVVVAKGMALGNLKFYKKCSVRCL